MHKVLFILCVVSGCSTVKNSTIATETPSSLSGPSVQIEAPDAADEMARTFVYALLEDKVEALAPYLLNVEIAKQVAPRETSALSDKEIYDQLVLPSINRLNENFKKLQVAMHENGIKKEQIKYDQVVHLDASDVANGIFPIEIRLNYIEKKFVIPVTIATIDQHCTIFEIINTTTVFFE